MGHSSAVLRCRSILELGLHVIGVNSGLHTPCLSWRVGETIDGGRRIFCGQGIWSCRGVNLLSSGDAPLSCYRRLLLLQLRQRLASCRPGLAERQRDGWHYPTSSWPPWAIRLSRNGIRVVAGLHGPLGVAGVGSLFFFGLRSRNADDVVCRQLWTSARRCRPAGWRISGSRRTEIGGGSGDSWSAGEGSEVGSGQLR